MTSACDWSLAPAGPAPRRATPGPRPAPGGCSASSTRTPSCRRTPSTASWSSTRMRAGAWCSIGSPPASPGSEPVEHQAPALVLVELQDAVDGVLRHDGVRVDEAEHPPGAGRGPDVARRGAGPAGAWDQSHADVIGEDPHDGRSGVLAPVVCHDDLEGGIREPEIVPGDAGSLSHARENGLQGLADQRLLVSRRDHEGETTLSHRAPASTRRPPGSGRVAPAAPAATGSAARPPPVPAEAPGRYRSAGHAW